MPIRRRQRVRIVPYRRGSRSARALADALGAKLVKLEGSRFRNTVDDFCINWGNTNPPPNIDLRFMLNHPKALEATTNKLTFFERVTAEGLGNFIPPYWTNKEDIPDEAFPIVCRTILNSHSGRGIVISDSRDDLVDAPLFTKYIKKQDEYRIHLGCPFRPPWEESIIISVQQKRRRLDVENPNWQVRNHANGFIYARENVNPPQCVIDAAKTVFNKCTELDFGAVDVIYNAKQDRAYVLEINSAPGLEGQTLQDYADYFPKEGQ